MALTLTVQHGGGSLLVHVAPKLPCHGPGVAVPNFGGLRPVRVQSDSSPIPVQVRLPAPAIISRFLVPEEFLIAATCDFHFRITGSADFASARARRYC